MPNSRLRDMLARAGMRMADELKERLVPHSGELGIAREEILRRFLRDNLPRRYEVSSGFVFDSRAISQQLDIIIADALVAPRFEVSGGIRFYPCESVVAVGQVKTHVSSRREMWDAINNLRSVSLLDRTADGQAVCDRTGQSLNPRENHLHRIFTFLIILERSLGGELARELLLEVVQRSEPHLWPNVIVALEKYVLTYCCDNGICPNTLDARAIALADASDFATGLLRFYIFLSQAINATSVSRMSSSAYLHRLLPLNADVIYSCTNDEGEPPPFLSTLWTGEWEYPYDDDSPASEDEPRGRHEPKSGGGI